jgi:chitinase
MGAAAVLVAAAILGLARATPQGPSRAVASTVQFGAAPYVMPLDNNPPDLPTVMSQSGIRTFTLAFVLAGGGCTPAWDGTAPVSSDTAVAAKISAVRSAGGDVAVAFGGANGTKLGQSCADPASTAAAMQQVIDRYQLRSIDLDIEEPEIENAAAVDRELRAAKILEDSAAAAGRQLFVAVTIPSTATGANFFGNLLIQNAVSAGTRVDAFSIMPFDFGGSNMGQAAITAAEDFHQQLKKNYPGLTDAQVYAMTGLSLMNGRTDSAEMYFLSDFQTVLGYAQQHGLARLTFWSVNRDRQCSPPDLQVTSGTCSSVAQNDWDYTRVIVRFTGATPPSPAPSPTATPTPRPSATPSPTPSPTATPTPPPPPPPGGNLVANPGFETGGLSAWTCSTVDSVVSAPAHSGAHALSGAASSSDNAQCTQTIGVAPNHTYTLSAWVQGSYAFIGDTGTGTTDTSTFAPSATSFAQLSVQFTTGPGTTSVTIFVHGWYGQGTIFADDFSVA